MRVRIEYGDQNESFAGCLPREGTVVSAFRSTTGDEWHQVSLDVPVDYQLKGPSGFRRVFTDQVLVRPRVVGDRIGSSRPAQIDLYLAEDSQLPLATPLKIEEYVPACWAICRVVAGAA